VCWTEWQSPTVRIGLASATAQQRERRAVAQRGLVDDVADQVAREDGRTRRR
jgi:hypothetical protein